jgi:hypothetical protein
MSFNLCVRVWPLRLRALLVGFPRRSGCRTALWVTGHAPMFGPPRRRRADKARSSEFSSAASCGTGRLVGQRAHGGTGHQGLIFCWHGPGAADGSGRQGERPSPGSGDLRSGVSFRISSRSRPSASISASTPYSADRSSRPVSTVCAPWCRGASARERRQHGGAEVPADPDQVRGGCQVHDAMITGGQVTPDHRDPARASARSAAWFAARWSPSSR